MPPKIQSLTGHEAARVGVVVKRFQLGHGQAGLLGDQSERVPGAHDPVRMPPMHGRVRTRGLGGGRVPVGRAGGRQNDEHDGDQHRGERKQSYEAG